jgi:hypothetical protein
MKRAAARFGWAALAVAWAVDLLFWGKTPGISFPIWVALVIAAGLLLARSLKVRPSPFSLILIAAALLFAGLTFIRQEAFTVTISFLLCFFSLALLSATFLTGNWVHYKIGGIIHSALQLMLAVLIRPPDLFLRKQPTTPSIVHDPSPGDQATNEPGASSPAPLLAAAAPGWKSAGQHAIPVVRGLVLALPILLILGALLASADPIFNNWMRNLLKIFDLSKIPEYLFRLTYILIVAYVLAGSYLHAVQPAVIEARPTADARWFSPFLGWTEGVVVLGAVNLLFAVFVGIQFWYLFGGQANISTSGFTYSEYARRGFNELVIVALLSLGLYLGMGAVVRQETTRQQRIMVGLNVLLIAQVLVILASSLSRLLLYEGAYGFTQLRTYTHIFIVWLAILLAVTVGLELTRRRHFFALAALLVTFAFGLTFGLMNVDGFIAGQNIQRAQGDVSLDGQYLTALSADAVPTLLAEYQRTNQPQAVKDTLGAELACREALLAKQAGQTTSWLSYNLSQATAASLLRANHALWQAYPVQTNTSGLVVVFPGGLHPCQVTRGID